MTNVTTLFRLGACLALLGCSGPHQAGQSPTGQLLQDAEKYVSSLRTDGKLPGYSGIEHGRIIAAAPWKPGKPQYPATVTVRAWKDGDDSTYFYTLVRAAPGAPWELVDANRLDNQDRVVERFLIK